MPESVTYVLRNEVLPISPEGHTAAYSHPSVAADSGHRLRSSTVAAATVFSCYLPFVQLGYGFTRRKKAVRRSSALVACLAAIVWVPAQAIVIRHDRDDQLYIELAKKFPATVIFRIQNSDFGMDGMGTLIDARWVMTAGHVVAELNPGDMAEIGGSRYEIEELVQYTLARVKSWNDVQRDIALVRLRTAVQGIEPALLYSKSDEAGSFSRWSARVGSETGARAKRNPT